MNQFEQALYGNELSEIIQQNKRFTLSNGRVSPTSSI
jgi:hypothetical protein